MTAGGWQFGLFVLMAQSCVCKSSDINGYAVLLLHHDAMTTRRRCCNSRQMVCCLPPAEQQRGAGVDFSLNLAVILACA
jgi:hypothetical protein